MQQMQVVPMHMQMQRPSPPPSLPALSPPPPSSSSLSSPSSTRSSSLAVVKQTSPFEERVTRNGIQRDIHVVIKNSPFIVQIACMKHPLHAHPLSHLHNEGGASMNLNHVAFEATLVYDTDAEKGVDFVKIKPIEYKCVPSEAGDTLAVELRIKVLTSQHEDMFFKVVVQGQDPVTKQDIPHMRVVTAPIKVISKPEQLKKKASVPAPSSSSLSSSSSSTPSSSTSSCSKKRTVNDMVVEAVTRIEKQQAEQAMMMERILNEIGGTKRAHINPSPAATTVPVSDAMNNASASWELPLTRVHVKEEGDFETCFVQLLKSFSAIDPNHRAEKVRRVARTLSVTDNEHFSELVDMLTSEGLGQETVRESRPMMNHTPLPLYDKMDNIFFTSMVPPYGANTGVMMVQQHASSGLNASIDYGDFLGFSAQSPNGEFLL